MTTNPVSPILFTKATLLGPPPYGGSVTIVEGVHQDLADRLLADGWTVGRRWGVTVNPEGRFETVDL